MTDLIERLKHVAMGSFKEQREQHETQTPQIAQRINRLATALSKLQNSEPKDAAYLMRVRVVAIRIASELEALAQDLDVTLGVTEYGKAVLAKEGRK